MFEEERKSNLWDTYVSIFLSNQYENVRKKMSQNKEFLEALIAQESFVGVTEKINRFVYGNQSTKLLEYVFQLAGWNGLEEYLSTIHGFDSRESAEYFVNQVTSNKILLGSSSIYDNTHSKLVDSGLKQRYTKARNKIAVKGT